MERDYRSVMVSEACEIEIAKEVVLKLKALDAQKASLRVRYLALSDDSSREIIFGFLAKLSHILSSEVLTSCDQD